jgi:hypothetical protein
MPKKKQKYKRLSAAERRAQVAQTISPAQLRFSMQQIQVVAKVGNTQAWEDVRKGLLKVYRDGRESFASREEVERYLRAKEAAARQEQEQYVPRAAPGRKGVVPRAPA